MFIVEWYDHKKERHELTFDNKADAELEAAKLGEEFPFVAVIAEVEI